jgi:hypothetical protein
MKKDLSQMKLKKFVSLKTHLILLLSLAAWTTQAQVSPSFQKTWQASIEESCQTAARNSKSFFVGSNSAAAVSNFCACVSAVTVEGELRDPDTGENRSESAVSSQLAIFKGILDNWSTYEIVIGKKSVFDLEKLSRDHKILMDNQLVRMEACDSK